MMSLIDSVVAARQEAEAVHTHPDSPRSRAQEAAILIAQVKAIMADLQVAGLPGPPGPPGPAAPAAADNSGLIAELHDRLDSRITALENRLREAANVPEAVDIPLPDTQEGTP